MLQQEVNEKEQQQLENEQLLTALENENIDQFRTVFLDIHPYERAKFYAKLPKDARMHVYLFLSPSEMAEVFENLEIDENEYEELLSEMDPTFVADMLSQMYADDAVDVLNELDKEQVASYLTIMDDEAAGEIKQLLHYEEYTAGSIMTTNLSRYMPIKPLNQRCIF